MKYILALALLCGCSAPTWDQCRIETWNHPFKPAPARDVTVTCARSLLCTNYTRNGKVVKCDGETLAGEEK